jgi:hypothetical protein
MKLIDRIDHIIDELEAVPVWMYLVSAPFIGCMIAFVLAFIDYLWQQLLWVILL